MSKMYKSCYWEAINNFVIDFCQNKLDQLNIAM